MGMAQYLQRLFQVAAPDVAAIDQAQRQHLVGRQAVEDGRVLLGRTYQVDVQAIDRQVGGQAQVVFQAAEVGGDQLLQWRPLKDVVDALVGILPVLRQVQGQDRLIDLHPFHALGSQAVENLVIQRQQAVEQLQLVEIATLGLAQPQVGQRADHHRFDRVAQGLGFCHFFEQLLPAQGELLVGGEFWDQVVVVGIEPLGHFLGVRAAAAAVTHGATGHGEQGLQGWPGSVVAAETLRDHAEGQRVGEHLVVPGEVADRQQFDAGVFLHLPVAGTQLATDGAQAGFVEFTLPEGFLGLFQLAVAADTWKAQVMCQCHVLSLSMHK